MHVYAHAFRWVYIGLHVGGWEQEWNESGWMYDDLCTYVNIDKQYSLIFCLPQTVQDCVGAKPKQNVCTSVHVTQSKQLHFRN